jgi:hypothetical protein
VPRPEYSKFIAEVIPNPSDPEDTVLLFGYIGASNKEDHSRVWTDLRLQNHIDVPDDDIIHAEPVRRDDPLAGIYVWVKADAKVVHRKSQVKVSFLEGNLQRRYGQSIGGDDTCCPPPPSPGPDCPGGGSPYPCPSVAGSHHCP